MNPPLFQQFEFVGLTICRIQNLKRPKELHVQLLNTFDFNIFAVQPNFLAGKVTSRLNSFIVDSFLQFLDVLQVFSICSYKITKFFNQLINCFAPKVGFDFFFIGNASVVLAVELKKCVTYAGIFRVIKSKFRYRQELCLVILFVINKSSKISFYYAVLPHSLAFGLRIESNKEPPFDAQEIAQRELKLGREY